MHPGVTEFVRFVEDRVARGALRVRPPASTTVLDQLEQRLGMPLPFDLRFVLSRFDGGELPTGELMSANAGPSPIEEGMATLSAALELDARDPESPLPFFRTHDGSVLAFERRAGPVSDTWPIVDHFPSHGDARLVHRTFDGFCRLAVAEWESGDHGTAFSLDAYLRRGERHAAIEPDVSTAHATVAHARRRSGQPEKALESYLAAARCVPALPWCDWEALKLATLLGLSAEGLEAAGRLSSPAPKTRWAGRDTTPTKVIDVIALLGSKSRDSAPFLRVLDQLLGQPLDKPEHDRAAAVRKALATGAPPPKPAPAGDFRANRTLDAEALWERVSRGYVEGYVRDEDLLLNPALTPLRSRPDYLSLLRLRREFR